MAGDPWYDCTTTTDYWTDTTSTTEVTSWGGCGSYTVSFTRRDENDPEYQKKLKELIRRAIIKNMHATWKQDKKEFKPIPKLRPDVQLRGVCFSGRGWA